MSSPAFHRDRLTIYSYITLAAYIWGVYGLGPALLLMRDETGMSLTVSSLHSTALAIGVILAGFIGSPTVARFGRGGTLQLGAALASVGLLGLAIFRNPALSIPSVVMIGVGGSIATNAMNAFFIIHHGKHAPGAIGESNAGAVLAGMLSPLAMGALVAAGANWRLALLVPVAMFAGARLYRGNANALEAQGETHHDAGSGALPRLYWWAWIAMLLCVATEFSFVIWSGDIMRDQAHVSTATAASSLSAMAVGMMISRLTIARLNRRFDIEQIFRASLVLPIVAWVPMWFSSDAMVMLALLFVIGIGLGYHFPLTLNRMLVSAPGLTDKAATKSSLASGIAIGGSPFLLATLSSTIGLHTAFVMVPLLLTLALLSAIKHPVAH